MSIFANILQSLLSQDHRLDALSLLLVFCSQDPWNVLQCLHVGLHPYITKLLQSPNEEIRPVLTAIWLRVMLVDWDAVTWDEGMSGREKESFVGGGSSHTIPIRSHSKGRGTEGGCIQVFFANHD